MAATTASACSGIGGAGDAGGAPRPRRAKTRPRIPSGISRIAATSTAPTDGLAGDRLVGGRRRVEQDRDHGGADRRAAPEASAAEHAHQHDRQRHRDVERAVRGDVRHEQRLDAARNTRERAGDAERDELVAIGRHAHDLRRVLVVVDGEESQPEPRARDRVRDRRRSRSRVPAPSCRTRPTASARASAPAPRTGKRRGRRRWAC